MTKIQTVVFTGVAPKNEHIPQERSFWTSMAQEGGHVVKNSVTSQTTLLVSSYLAAKEGSVKWIEANERGIPVVSYEEFFFNYFGECAKRVLAV